MRGTGSYPEETFEQREERLRYKDEHDSYRVKQVIEDRDVEEKRREDVHIRNQTGTSRP